MKKDVDFIYVPKADINEGLTTAKITKAALYFTKEFLFVLPFETLDVLLAGVETRNKNMDGYVSELNTQIPDLDIESFQRKLLNLLDPDRIYKISDLDKFSIQVGFWIFGGLHIRKKGGQMQTFNIQPKAIREEIKAFYNII